MPAFVIVDIDITDPVGYKEYRRLATPTVTACGGQNVARGGRTEVLEGSWQPNRIVILQFDSIEKAKGWLNSEEYREPRKIRHRTARTSMIVTEGL